MVDVDHSRSRYGFKLCLAALEQLYNFIYMSINKVTARLRRLAGQPEVMVLQ